METRPPALSDGNAADLAIVGAPMRAPGGFVRMGSRTFRLAA